LDNKKLFSLKFDQNSLEVFLRLSAGSAGGKKQYPQIPQKKAMKDLSL
jgi:hypothetical protein